MQVKALVHETKVDQLRLGMRASIKIQDQVFRGEITSISNQPEANTWFQGNVKEYATLIKIDGEPEGLKPGMTAQLDILVSQKKDVLQVPVQCVVERANKFYAYVKNGQGIEPRNLVLGGTNDTVMEVVDGLKEGELVLLNPRADVPNAADQAVEPDDLDINKRPGLRPEGQRHQRRPHQVPPHQAALLEQLPQALRSQPPPADRPRAGGALPVPQAPLSFRHSRSSIKTATAN
jgi:hypothetical protein